MGKHSMVTSEKRWYGLTSPRVRKYLYNLAVAITIALGVIGVANEQWQQASFLVFSALFAVASDNTKGEENNEH